MGRAIGGGARASARRARGQAPAIPAPLLSASLLVPAVLLLALPLAPTMALDVRGSPSVSEDGIRAWLASKNPALLKEDPALPRTLYKEGVEHGIDPAIALAFFNQESSYGTAGVARSTKGIGNVKGTGPAGSISGFRAYHSWSEGAADWYDLIATRGPYIAEGRTTVEQIVPKYAPRQDRNDPVAYIANVVRTVEGIRGYKERLTEGAAPSGGAAPSLPECPSQERYSNEVEFLGDVKGLFDGLDGFYAAILADLVSLRGSVADQQARCHAAIEAFAAEYGGPCRMAALAPGAGVAAPAGGTGAGTGSGAGSAPAGGPAPVGLAQGGTPVSGVGGATEGVPAAPLPAPAPQPPPQGAAQEGTGAAPGPAPAPQPSPEGAAQEGPGAASGAAPGAAARASRPAHPLEAAVVGDAFGPEACSDAVLEGCLAGEAPRCLAGTGHLPPIVPACPLCTAEECFRGVGCGTCGGEEGEEGGEGASEATVRPAEAAAEATPSVTPQPYPPAEGAGLEDDSSLFGVAGCEGEGLGGGKGTYVAVVRGAHANAVPSAVRRCQQAAVDLKDLCTLDGAGLLLGGGAHGPTEVLARLDRLVADVEGFVATIKAASTEAGRLADETAKDLGGGGGGGGGKGTRLVNPLNGVRKSFFGPREYICPECSLDHTGLDIAGNPGDPIVAAAGGVVKLEPGNYFNGNVVHIDHGNGVETQYAHTSKFLVANGQVVKAGEPIAQVGTTGKAIRGAHLHFEIRINGRPVNPEDYLDGKASLSLLHGDELAVLLSKDGDKVRRTQEDLRNLVRFLGAYSADVGGSGEAVEATSFAVLASEGWSRAEGCESANEKAEGEGAGEGEEGEPGEEGAGEGGPSGGDGKGEPRGGEVKAKEAEASPGPTKPGGGGGEGGAGPERPPEELADEGDEPDHLGECPEGSLRGGCYAATSQGSVQDSNQDAWEPPALAALRSLAGRDPERLFLDDAPCIAYDTAAPGAAAAVPLEPAPSGGPAAGAQPLPGGAEAASAPQGGAAGASDGQAAGDGPSGEPGGQAPDAGAPGMAGPATPAPAPTGTYRPPAASGGPEAGAGSQGADQGKLAACCRRMLGAEGGADVGSAIAYSARTWVGSPYARGGSDRSGTDGPGLVMKVAEEHGLRLPRTAPDQLAGCEGAGGARVGRDALRPGDVVFLRGEGGAGVADSAVYVGGGLVVRAVEGSGVATSRLSEPGLAGRWAGACRVAPGDALPAAASVARCSDGADALCCRGPGLEGQLRLTEEACGLGCEGLCDLVHQRGSLPNLLCRLACGGRDEQCAGLRDESRCALEGAEGLCCEGRCMAGATMCEGRVASCGGLAEGDGCAYLGGGGACCGGRCLPGPGGCGPSADCRAECLNLHPEEPALAASCRQRCEGADVSCEEGCLARGWEGAAGCVGGCPWAGGLLPETWRFCEAECLSSHPGDPPRALLCIRTCRAARPAVRVSLSLVRGSQEGESFLAGESPRLRVVAEELGGTGFEGSLETSLRVGRDCTCPPCAPPPCPCECEREERTLQAARGFSLGPGERRSLPGAAVALGPELAGSTVRPAGALRDGSGRLVGEPLGPVYGVGALRDVAVGDGWFSVSGREGATTAYPGDEAVAHVSLSCSAAPATVTVFVAGSGGEPLAGTARSASLERPVQRLDIRSSPLAVAGPMAGYVLHIGYRVESGGEALSSGVLDEQGRPPGLCLERDMPASCEGLGARARPSYPRAYLEVRRPELELADASFEGEDGEPVSVASPGEAVHALVSVANIASVPFVGSVSVEVVGADGGPLEGSAVEAAVASLGSGKAVSALSGPVRPSPGSVLRVRVRAQDAQGTPWLDEVVPSLLFPRAELSIAAEDVGGFERSDVRTSFEHMGCTGGVACEGCLSTCELRVDRGTCTVAALRCDCPCEAGPGR